MVQEEEQWDFDEDILQMRFLCFFVENNERFHETVENMPSQGYNTMVHTSTENQMFKDMMESVPPNANEFRGILTFICKPAEA